MTTQNLLVELFVEELPPKALKKLGEAFAGVLATSSRPGPGRCDRSRHRLCLAAPAGGAHHAWRRRRRQGGAQKLMPVTWAWTPTASPRRRC
jgi:glycyl-tRNA synthetase beta chain